jgi:hypothetical protein
MDFVRERFIGESQNKEVTSHALKFEDLVCDEQLVMQTRKRISFHTWINMPLLTVFEAAYAACA